MTSKSDDQDLCGEVVDVEEERESEQVPRPTVPLPTPHFRRRAWIAFQRALDPLSPPRPLPRQRA